MRAVALPGIRVLWRQKTNTQGLQKSCGGKGRRGHSPSEREGLGVPWPCSQEESALTLALTGFCCFSGHITLRMVLICYAQVHFRWLPFTENKGEDVANCTKKEGYLQM